MLFIEKKRDDFRIKIILKAPFLGTVDKVGSPTEE